MLKRILITACTALLCSTPAYSSYDGWGSGNYLSGSFGTAFNTPMSIVGWIKCDAAGWAVTSLTAIVDINDDLIDQANSQRLVRGHGGADRVSARTVAGGSDSATFAFADGTYDDTWVFVAAVFTAATDDRIIYIENSSNSDTSTQNVTTNDVDEITVGSNFDGTSQNMPSGCKVAEIAVFDTELTTTQIDDGQTGSETGPQPCSIAPANCIGYWSLDSDQATHADESGNGGPSLSENGAVAFNADHPTITGDDGGFWWWIQ